MTTTDMTIVAISDTHGKHSKVKLPSGDILVHSGDFTAYGNMHEFRDFIDWFAAQPFKYKVFTCGNHDAICERNLESCKAYVPAGVNFLMDQSVVIDGRVFYGSPWTPTFYDWSFMASRGEAIGKVWARIPDEVDVLITHGPPYGHGDAVPSRLGSSSTCNVGCIELLKRVYQVKPRVHIFGHIHEGYGRTDSDEITRTTFVNAATCNSNYKPKNRPQVIVLH